MMPSALASKGMKMHIPTWLYHKEHQPKVFTNLDEAKEALKNGWSDSPKVMYDKQEVKQTEHHCHEPHVNEEIKEKDFASMTVSELKEELLKKGYSYQDLKGIKKDELILKLGQS